MKYAMTVEEHVVLVFEVEVEADSVEAAEALALDMQPTEVTVLRESAQSGGRQVVGSIFAEDGDIYVYS